MNRKIAMAWLGAVLLSASKALAQSTETFETENSGATSFTDNAQVFNVTSQARGPFDIQAGFPGTGWSGTSADDRYIDNDGFAVGGSPVGFTISSQGAVPFTIKSLYLYLANNFANINVAGTLTIVGRRNAVTQFTATGSGSFNNTNPGVNNGFTLIDFSNFGGSNNSNTVVDQLIFTTTGSFNYVALDAFRWALGAIAPTATNMSAAESYTEDQPLNLTNIVVTDPDSTVTATLTLSNTAAGSLSTATSGSVTSTYSAGSGIWTASGAVASVNTLLAGVSFIPAANFNANFTIATSVTDGSSAPVTGTKSITGIATNDAPTATNLSAAESYTEDQTLNLADIVVTDPDSTVTATLTLSNTAAGSLSTATSGAVTSTYSSGTGIWTATGAVADVNVLLAGVSFIPAANFNANFTIATSVTDSAAPAVTGTKSITGIATNDAPTATNLSAAESYTEDQTLNLADIVVTDPDSTVTATLTLSNTAAGSLSTATSGAVTSTYSSGTGIWSASGAVADVNVLLAGVSFIPAANFNANFTIATSVTDSAAPAVTGTKSMTGNATNDAPTATNLSAAESYTEDQTLNLADIVVTDIDNATTTVTLTLSNTAAGSLSTATSGAVTSTYSSGTGIWSASGAVANVNSLLAGVSFIPAANFNANFTIATSVTDSAAPAITGIKSMTGNASNDAPTATNLSAAETYTEDQTLNLADIVVTDIDNATTTVTLTLSNTAAGALSTATSGAVTSTYTSATGVWAASGAVADVNVLLAGVSFIPAANFNANFTIATSVNDSAAPAITGTKSMTGNATNDAPTATNLSAAESYTEDQTLNLADIVVSDIDNATTTVTLTLSNTSAGALSTATSGAVTSTYSSGTGVWAASGAVADVNVLLAGVSFIPAANFNANFTISTSVSDSAAPAVTGSKSMTGNATNDAPTATNLSAAESYTEDQTLNLADIVVSDVDNATTTVTLTLSNISAGSLSTATSGSVTSTYSPGTGVWTASGAVADVNALLAGVSFIPAPSFSANFTIATSVSDGVAAAVTGTKSMTGTGVNDAPSATSLSSAENYTEDVAVDLTDIVVSDPDSAVTVTLTLSNVAAGSLSTATSGAVTSTYTSATGVWAASGAVADVNALLAGLSFIPAANFNANFTIATSVSDGVAAALTGVKPMTGTPVNDAPTATNLSAAESYTEDQTLNLADIVVSDVDNATTTVTLTLSNTAAGALSTATSGAVTSTYTTATGIWTASGAVADVNALLAGVSFTPAQNFNANFTIASSVTDGLAAALTGSKSTTGTAVNDAPTATNLSAAETYTEDSSLDLADIVVTDVDDVLVTVTLTLSAPAAGALSTASSGAVTSTYDAVTGVWTASGAVADVNALLAGVRFLPAANFNGAFSIATSASDGVAAALTGSKSMTGTAVTDCTPEPCQNGGVCSDVATGFTCTCAAGFSGATCIANIDECSPNPCANGGTCTDGVNTFTCACAAGYSGTTCATDVNECATSPCQNGGTCADGVNSYACTCAAGFMGARCEVNVNDCSPNPCQNSGTCTDGVNAFTCQCATGFTGTTCGTVDSCATNPCQNGATCADSANGFTCTCAAGFMGATCATNINDCDPNPCLYGGVCTDAVNGFTCACQPGFSGTTCGSNTDECAPNPCQNGGTCTDDTNGFVCTCADGFTGTTCAQAEEPMGGCSCSSGGGSVLTLLLWVMARRRQRRR